jgi:magnesium chelatase family protein
MLIIEINSQAKDGQSLMRAAMSQLNLSARAYHRTRSVKLARTIADLAGCVEIQSVHLAEARHFRLSEVDVVLILSYRLE